MHQARTDLERIVGRELRELPSPRAPHTLLPRVMAAVHEWARRPWYTREWLSWPLGWQLASAVALLLLLGGVLALLPQLRELGGALITSGPVLAMCGELDALARTAGLAASTAATLWRALFEPFVAYAFVIVMVLCLACAAFGTALSRVAFGRALPL